MTGTHVVWFQRFESVLAGSVVSHKHMVRGWSRRIHYAVCVVRVVVPAPRPPPPPCVCVCVWLRGPPIHPAVLCGDMRGRRVPWVRPAGLRTVVPRSDVVMVPDKPSVPAPRRQRQGSLVVKQPVINVFAPDYDPEATAGAREYERMRQHQRTLDRITRRLRPSWPREGVHRILGRLRFEDPMPGKRRWQVENSVVNGAPLGLARDVRAR